MAGALELASFDGDPVDPTGIDAVDEVAGKGPAVARTPGADVVEANAAGETLSLSNSSDRCAPLAAAKA
jgi:hypothetical protein